MGTCFKIQCDKRDSGGTQWMGFFNTVKRVPDPFLDKVLSEELCPKVSLFSCGYHILLYSIKA